METPKHHIFVCASFRTDGEAKGMCAKKGSSAFLPYIENEILDRGIDAQITAAGCMKMCDNGPVMVIYPENIWYGGVETEDAGDEIMDALEDGNAADAYRLNP